jgi:hypothetical protein
VDDDALAQLAAALKRPPASLSAFSRLDREQIALLTAAVKATCERRREEIDTELARAFPAPIGPLFVRPLRGPGFAPLRHALIRRSQ